MSRLKVGIIGGGNSSAVGRAHITALSIDRDWEIVSIVPSADDVLNELPASLKDGVQIYQDLDLLIRNGHKDKLDFVVVLTPSDLHFEHGKKVLENKFNLITEKPLCLNSHEAQTLKLIAEKNKLKLYTIQNYSAFVMIMALKKFIEQSSLGKILHIQAKMIQQGFVRKINNEHPKIQEWRMVDPEIPMVMQDLGSHLFHLVGFLTSNLPIQVTANYTKSNLYPNLISSCEILARDEDGSSYNLIVGKSFLGNQNNLEIEIFGSTGSVKWQLNNSELLEYTKDDGSKIYLDRQWAENEFTELVIFSRFKPGHAGGFIEALANYYLILKYDFTKNDKLSNYITKTQDIINYIKVLEACSRSQKFARWEYVHL
jgi:predicted dehydrogenase